MNAAPSTPQTDPGAAYEAAIRLRKAAAVPLLAREARISWLRLGVFAVAAVTVWFSLVRPVWPQWIPLLPAALFLLLVVLHEKTSKARRMLERSVRFYEEGLRRIRKEFDGTSAAGARFLDPSHPYAEDLDLFGSASVFALLSTARTEIGEARLASWLLEGASAEVVLERQAAVAELRDRLPLREELALLGEDTVASVDPLLLEPLTAHVAFPLTVRIAAALLALANAVTLVLWITLRTGAAPFFLSAVVAALFARWLAPAVKKELQGIEKSRSSLAILSLMLERLEREPFDSPLLLRVRGELGQGEARASRAIARLERIVDLLDAKRNQLFLPFASLLLWTTQMSFLVESWKRAHGTAASRWLGAIAELEALSSLASFAFEHPSYPFPSLVRGRVFEAEGLGHPLIHEDRMVANDVKLGNGTQLLIVSGSNMSGKSTLLRSVGTNAVLALAGAPVCATRLTLSPLAVGSSVTVHDSLQQGRSRFYAEISRLRQLVELAQGEVPLLFLIDEMLHGTNSHDRRIGAEAILRSLVERGAIGIVTTHDLALATIAESLQARNVHFEDRIEDGGIAFDYRMRDGVVTRSNALELMRSVGLDV